MVSWLLVTTLCEGMFPGRPAPLPFFLFCHGLILTVAERQGAYPRLAWERRSLRLRWEVASATGVARHAPVEELVGPLFLACAPPRWELVVFSRPGTECGLLRSSRPQAYGGIPGAAWVHECLGPRAQPSCVRCFGSPVLHHWSYFFVRQAGCRRLGSAAAPCGAVVRPRVASWAGAPRPGPHKKFSNRVKGISSVVKAIEDIRLSCVPVMPQVPYMAIGAVFFPPEAGLFKSLLYDFVSKNIHNNQLKALFIERVHYS